YSHLFYSTIPRSPRSTLFPYTTLFRSYQIFTTLNEDLKYVDSNQLIYIIPIIAIIIPSIYLVRAQIFNKINTVSKTMEELEDEFKISPKNFWQRVKQYF